MEKLGILIAIGLAFALAFVIADERWDLTRRARRWLRRSRRVRR